MINVVCLKWGKKYGPEYVNRLYSAVERNTTRPFRFWCFTEDSVGINSNIKVVPLQFADQLDSWWNKISLFSNDNGLPIGEQIVYIDLDTLIVDNIDQLLDVEIVPDLLVLRDFYHGIAKSAGQIGSGLMSWRHGQYDHVWQNFVEDPAAAIESVYPHGDQHWIESQISAWYCWQDLFPDSVVSFKMHCQSGIPPGAKIICYHGVPSIPDSVTYSGRSWRYTITPQPWVLDYWRDQ
jgi:hypothetical protein